VPCHTDIKQEKMELETITDHTDHMENVFEIIKKDGQWTLEISEEIKNFIETKEGRQFLTEITPGLTHATRTCFKKSLLDPPKNVRRHMITRALLKNRINEIKLKKKLDK
jgi:hypothetical protein